MSTVFSWSVATEEFSCSGKPRSSAAMSLLPSRRAEKIACRRLFELFGLALLCESLQIAGPGLARLLSSEQVFDARLKAQQSRIRKFTSGGADGRAGFLVKVQGQQRLRARQMQTHRRQCLLESLRGGFKARFPVTCRRFQAGDAQVACFQVRIGANRPSPVRQSARSFTHHLPKPGVPRQRRSLLRHQRVALEQGLPSLLALTRADQQFDVANPAR